MSETKDVVIARPAHSPWSSWVCVYVDGELKYVGPTPDFDSAMALVAGKPVRRVGVPTSVAQTWDTAHNVGVTKLKVPQTFVEFEAMLNAEEDASLARRIALLKEQLAVAEDARAALKI